MPNLVPAVWMRIGNTQKLEQEYYKISVIRTHAVLVHTPQVWVAYTVRRYACTNRCGLHVNSAHIMWFAGMVCMVHQQSSYMWSTDMVFAHDVAA